MNENSSTKPHAPSDGVPSCKVPSNDTLPTDALSDSEKKPVPASRPKRIAAWICIFALIALYIATFLAAILDAPGSGRMFRTCLGATIVLPVLLWMYLWLYGRLRERDKIEN